MNSLKHLKKCGYCSGKDGKKKDVYETIQSAIDAAKFFEEERGIYLNAYKCPHGNGWHLTKNDADCEIIERQASIFINNDIPIKSSGDNDIAWEYIKPEKPLVETTNEKIILTAKNSKTAAPIKKMECASEDQTVTIAGKIMEIYKNIDIEKFFKINLDNAFSASMAKEFLNKKIDQITIYVERPEARRTESYTLLIENSIMKKNKLARGCNIAVELKAKIINNIKTWRAGALKSA
jgi:hypothetical protein